MGYTAASREWWGLHCSFHGVVSAGSRKWLGLHCWFHGVVWVNNNNNNNEYSSSTLGGSVREWFGLTLQFPGSGDGYTAASMK